MFRNFIGMRNFYVLLQTVFPRKVYINHYNKKRSFLRDAEDVFRSFQIVLKFSKLKIHFGCHNAILKIYGAFKLYIFYIGWNEILSLFDVF